jgi:hypothetical protein
VLDKWRRSSPVAAVTMALGRRSALMVLEELRQTAAVVAGILA